VQAKTDYYRKVNLAEAQLTKEKQELREAQQIRADLRADQMKQVERQQPSKLKRLGQGMAGHMKKAKAKQNRPMIGVPQSRTPTQTGASQGGIFGGQRNLDVGGNSGSPFNIGNRNSPPAPKEKRTTIIIKQ